MIINYSKSSFVKKYIQKLNIKRKLSSLLKKNPPSINYFAEMLKTLTEYFNAFANTGFGCLECSPARPDLPGAPGICTFQGFAGTQGALGTRPGVQHPAGWRNRGSSRSCCCLLSVQCKHQMWSGAKKQKRDLPLGCWGGGGRDPKPPWRLLHPPGCRKAQRPLPGSTGAPRAVPAPAPAARVPHSPSLGPRRSLCLCRAAPAWCGASAPLTWHRSAALEPPVLKATGKPHSPAPKAPLPQGHRTVPLALLPKEQLENVQSKPVTEQCQQSHC